jgi:hypothetical protein
VFLADELFATIVERTVGQAYTSSIYFFFTTEVTEYTEEVQGLSKIKSLVLG